MFIKHSNSPKQGFSLIEVLVAIAVIAIAMGIMGYLVNALRSTASSDEATAAANFSRTYIDVLRSRWQIPSEYVRGGGVKNPPEAAMLELSEPPAVFSEYTITIENLDPLDPDFAVIQSETYTYSSSDDSRTEAYYSPRFEDDTLRRITIQMKSRDGELLTPFVTEIVAPTVTR